MCSRCVASTRPSKMYFFALRKQARKLLIKCSVRIMLYSLHERIQDNKGSLKENVSRDFVRIYWVKLPSSRGATAASGGEIGNRWCIHCRLHVLEQSNFSATQFIPYSSAIQAGGTTF